jgi:O-antigen/teichoic acid export membrane protein
MSFSTAISGVFLPKITAMVTCNNSDEEVSDLFIKTGRIQYIVISLILSGFVIFGKEFILIWAGQNYQDAYSISLIIMIPLAFPLIQSLGISILQARNQQKFRSILYVLVALFSMAISIPLAKLYGGIGCAIGTSVALVLGNIITINIYYYKYIHIDIPHFWKEILHMTFPVSIMTSLGFILNQVILVHSILFLFFKILAYLVIFSSLIWRLGLNSYERNIFANPIKAIFSKIIMARTARI